MKLKDLQTQFLDDILHSSNAPHINLIDNGGQLSPAERIEIYSEGYQLRLLEALMDTYPAVHTLLGDEDFDIVGRDYIAAHPSRHFSLRYFGDQFSQFIQQHPDYGQTEILFEMAMLEWQLRKAFDAEDKAYLTREELSAIDINQWGDLYFTPHPSFSTIFLQWNTTELWKAIIQEAPPQAPNMLTEPQHWIIWRPKLETQFRSTDVLEILILDQLTQPQASQKKSFTEICEFISLEVGEGAETTAINYLSRWVDEGLLTSFKV